MDYPASGAHGTIEACATSRLCDNTRRNDRSLRRLRLNGRHDRRWHIACPAGRSGGQQAMNREALRRRAINPLLAAATVVVAFAFVSGLRLPGLGAAIAAPPATGTVPGPKRMSDSGLARIRGSEAFMARSYDDGVGNPTIGYGHLIRP